VKPLVVGTQNEHKFREIQDILLALPLLLRPLPAGTPLVVEDAGTIEGNAVLKACQYAKATGLPCLAEDTGLEVDALGGEPGVETANYAGPAAPAAENRAKLLGALAGVPAARRTARFRTVAALARPSGELFATAEGVLEGRITDAERGGGGFGYDPLFALAGDPAERTLAELGDDEKNALSHRARALQAIRPKILELL
jgi:XTP/dITP diphosphohydrolase